MSSTALKFDADSIKQTVQLSGSFRRSASLAIPHRTSFTAKTSVFRVHLGHMNRNASVSHELQLGVALVQPLSRLTLAYQHGEVKKSLCFAEFEFLTFHGLFASHDLNPYPTRSCIARWRRCMSPKQCSTSPPPQLFEQVVPQSVQGPQ